MPVHAFDDVDFPARWPVGTKEPEGRPHAANPAGHVCYVGDEEAVGVGLLAGHAHGGAPASRVFSRVVDAEVDPVATVASKGVAVCRRGAGEGDVAVGGVCAAEEGEAGEEVGAVVGLLDGVCACDAGNVGEGRTQPERIG